MKEINPEQLNPATIPKPGRNVQVTCSFDEEDCGLTGITYIGSHTRAEMIWNTHDITRALAATEAPPNSPWVGHADTLQERLRELGEVALADSLEELSIGELMLGWIIDIQPNARTGPYSSIDITYTLTGHPPLGVSLPYI